MKLRGALSSGLLLALCSFTLDVMSPRISRAEEAGNVPPTTPTITTHVERIELDNGLEVLLLPDRSHPRVAVCVSYFTGLRDQRAGYRGLAHLTEHLMFQGSRNVGEDQFFQHLERSGATSRNATTDPDFTSYWEVVPSNRLATVLWLESDRMAYMLDHLNETTLDQQREVVLSEFRQEHRGSPLDRVNEIILRYVFPLGHPYHMLLDRPDDLRAIRIEHVQWFFQHWYRPNNARLAIVGDFEVEEARALVEQYFAGIRSSHQGRPERRAAAPFQLPGDRRVQFAAPVIMPEIRIYWPTPAYQRAGDAELDFAARLLGMGPLSRLHRRLVTESGLATSVAARQHSYELASFFVVRVILNRGQSHEAALQVVDEEIEHLSNETLDQELVAGSRYHFRSQLLLGNEDLANRAFRLAYLRSPLAEDRVYRIEDNLARYDRVDAEGVRRAIGEHLPTNRRVVMFIMPAPQAPHSGAVISNRVVR